MQPFQSHSEDTDDAIRSKARDINPLYICESNEKKMLKGLLDYDIESNKQHLINFNRMCFF